jgi:Kef-type K+ transport system membrane component KefB
VALAALAALRVPDLAALAVLALLVALVGRFPQRVLRERVVAGAGAVAGVVVTLFLARLILARALASPRPAMAAPDSATE